MTMQQEEQRVRLCYIHKDLPKETFDESWKWNPVWMLPAESCQIEGCTGKAYWLSIGLRFPDSIGELVRDSGSSRANCEIYQEAREVLRKQHAIDAVTDYLNTRKSLVVKRKLFNKFASLILRELGIKDTITLSDAQKHRILDYLEMYPDLT